MSSAPLRSSEKWSGGFFGGCYVPLPGAQRGHLICRVIDKCGRGVAVPTSPPPPGPRSSSLLPLGSLPASCQKRCPVASRSSGDLPALGGAARARRRAPAPGRTGPRLCWLPRLPAGRCCGRLRGKLRVARSPGKFSALGDAALNPLPFPAASPRGGGGSDAESLGEIRRGHRASGRPRWPPPSARARSLRDSPRGRGRAPDIAQPRGHRRAGSPRAGCEPPVPRRTLARAKAARVAVAAVGPSAGHQASGSPGGRARRAELAVGDR